MARKKTIETEAIEQSVEIDGIADATVNGETVEETGTITDSEDNFAAVDVCAMRIPDNVKDILRIFSKYPELLVTTKGGAFVPGTKLPLNEEAILYKNPYYN